MPSFCPSFSTKRQACNYYCKICRNTDKIPNILGRFIIQNDKRILCTGCNNLFTEKELASVAINNFVYAERILF